MARHHHLGLLCRRLHRVPERPADHRHHGRRRGPHLVRLFERSRSDVLRRGILSRRTARCPLAARCLRRGQGGHRRPGEQGTCHAVEPAGVFRRWNAGEARLDGRLRAGAAMSMSKVRTYLGASAPALLLGFTAASSCGAADAGRPYGLTSRPVSKPYLSMPDVANGKFPPLLSQTGAFADVRTLKPNATLIPYDLVLAFWSDGARKSRWISLPQGTIKFSPTGEWLFADGTVFVKHFE